MRSRVTMYTGHISHLVLTLGSMGLPTKVGHAVLGSHHPFNLLPSLTSSRCQGSTFFLAPSGMALSKLRDQLSLALNTCSHAHGPT